jgi:hypothetical protein
MASKHTFLMGQNVAKIGTNIRMICDVLKAHGPLHYRRVSECIAGVEHQNVHKYLQRAVKHGIVNRVGDTYALEPEWDKAIITASTQKPKLKLEIETTSSYKPVINSVWSLANV